MPITEVSHRGDFVPPKGDNETESGEPVGNALVQEVP